MISGRIVDNSLKQIRSVLEAKFGDYPKSQCWNRLKHLCVRIIVTKSFSLNIRTVNKLPIGRKNLLFPDRPELIFYFVKSSAIKIDFK